MPNLFFAVKKWQSTDTSVKRLKTNDKSDGFDTREGFELWYIPISFI